MRKGLFALVTVGLIAGSAAANTAKADENSAAYKRGMLVGYAELCNEYHGTKMDFLLANKVKKRFRSNADFESGYDEMAAAKGYDSIRGLTDCDKVPNLMEMLRVFTKN